MPRIHKKYVFFLIFLCLLMSFSCPASFAQDLKVGNISIPQYVEDELIVTVDPQENHAEAVFSALIKNQQSLEPWFGSKGLDAITDKIVTVDLVTPFPLINAQADSFFRGGITVDSARVFFQDLQQKYKQHIESLQKKYPSRSLRRLAQEDDQSALTMKYSYLIKVRGSEDLQFVKETLSKVPGLHVDFNWTNELFPIAGQSFQKNTKPSTSKGGGLVTSQELPVVGSDIDGKPNYTSPIKNPYYNSSGNISDHQTYQDLYGIHMIDVDQVWDFNDPASLGWGTTVAVIDTGVDYNHPDIDGNIWKNTDEIPGNNVDDDGNGYVDDVKGWDFNLSGDNDPMDTALPFPSSSGHGTHCAGIIAAENNDIGIIGVAPLAKIMALRVFPSGDDGRLAQAIYYAVNNGADVLSCSWGGLGRFVQGSILKEAIDYAYAQGCIVVFAAGNNGDYGWPYADVGNSRPANYHKAIAVAATNWLDEKSHFSSYGELVDVAAPGENILSLRAAGTDMAYNPQQNNALANCVPNGDPNAQYYVSSGTSMACPFVSGLAALLVAKVNNTSNFTSSWFQLTNNEIRERIKRTADNVYFSGVNQEHIKNHDLGSGRINVAKAFLDPFDWVESEPLTLVITDDQQSQGSEQQIFPALDHGDASWGDYDNDGYLDLILMGRVKEKVTGYSWPTVRIYHNKGKDINGQVALEDSGIQLYMEGDSGDTFDGVEDGSVAWGDYDKDGFLDLIIAGEYFTGIYRNKGLSASGECLGFTRILVNVPDIAQGSVAWIDHDNDGDLDLLIAGKASTPATVCKIYRNDGNDTFVATDAINFGSGSGQGFYDSSIAVGDYDQDGDADVVVSGIHNGTRKTYLLENTLSGFITHDPSQTNLPNVSHGSLAFGDYDQDGDLDLLVTGDLNSSTQYIASVYRNDGNAQFVSLGSDCFALPSDMSNSYGLTNGSAVWGDYDNDGDLDVLLTGESYINQSSVTRIYFNNLIDPQDSVKAFSCDSNAVFPPLRYSKGFWADYDKDHDLDVLVFGEDVFVTQLGQSPFPVTNLYRNNAWEYKREQFDRNAAPMPPTGLTMSYEYEQGKVNIVYKWNPSEDNETLERFKTTGTQGISYNLVIGTKPDNCLMKSPMSYFHPWWLDGSSGTVVTVPGNYSDGFMRLVRLGPQDYAIDSNGKVTWTLKGLSSAEYYPWGVQAVDAAFAGSPFAYYYATGPGMPVQKISGKVWDVNANAGIPGVKVKATPGSYCITDANGNYYLYVPQGTNGTVWVEYYDQQVWNALQTQPTNHVYTNITSNMVNQDFLVDIRVKGKVFDEMTGQGRPGVLIGAENFGNNYFTNLVSVYSGISGSGGSYDIGVPFGTLTRVRPLDIPQQYYIAVYSPYPTHYSEGYIFSSRVKKDFRIKGVSISGYVYTASGWQLGDSWPPPAGTNFNPVTNITITAVNTSQQSQTYGTFNTGATTNSSGFYKFKVPYGWYGTVTAVAACEAHPQNTGINQWFGNQIAYGDVEAEQSLQNFYMAGAIAYPFSTIKGKVWHDLDVAGDIDPNEPAIAGEVVQIVPAAGQLLPSYVATTDVNGNYQASVVDGTYIVKHQNGGVNPQTVGFVHSWPNAYANQAIAQYQVTVSNGQIAAAKDFGIYKPEAPPGQISGLVFNDLAGDGVYNLGTDLDGIATLILQGTTVAGLTFSQNLSAQGQYVFNNVPVGNYTLTMQPASGFIASTPTVINVILGPGQANTNNNFGEYLPAIIQGKVFWDQNANNTYDAGEPGIANTQVWIERVGSGQPPIATLTDSAGLYSFYMPLTGTYRVFHQGTGSWSPIHTYPANNGTVAGSPTVNTGNFAQYTAINVSSGQTISQIDFGSRSQPGK